MNMDRLDAELESTISDLSTPTLKLLDKVLGEIQSYYELNPLDEVLIVPGSNYMKTGLIFIFERVLNLSANYVRGLDDLNEDIYLPLTVEDYKVFMRLQKIVKNRLYPSENSKRKLNDKEEIRSLSFSNGTLRVNDIELSFREGSYSKELLQQVFNKARKREKLHVDEMFDISGETNTSLLNSGYKNRFYQKCRQINKRVKECVGLPVLLDYSTNKASITLRLADCIK